MSMGTRPVQQETVQPDQRRSAPAILPPPTPPRKHFWFSELGGGVLLLASCGQRPGILLNILKCTTKNDPAPDADSGEVVKPCVRLNFVSVGGSVAEAVCQEKGVRYFFKYRASSQGQNHLLCARHCAMLRLQRWTSQALLLSRSPGSCRL